MSTRTRVNRINNVSGTPWLWVPTLYIAEGIPYFIVTVLSIALFKDLGESNTRIALFTSLITFPWVIKPLWSPFVDVIRTKRWWVIWMQVMMCVSVGLLAWLAPKGYFTIALVLFTITAFASATHDIAADGYYMLALTDKQQSAFVGIRSTFYKLANIFCQSVLLVLVGVLSRKTSVTFGWTFTLLLCSAILALIALWHVWAMPKSEVTAVPNSSSCGIWNSIGEAWATFFQKKGIILALCFMLLYRLPEALLLKMELPFLRDSMEVGGLGLTQDMIGLLNFIAIGLMLLGGIAGGLVASKCGLKKVMLWMCLMLTLPCIVYCYMSIVQPVEFWKIAACIGFEQLGYGLGYTACMLYMIYFADGQYKTAHFSICTAFMFLGLMLPGLVAGWIADHIGYINFFWMVMFCCIPSILITLIVQRKL